MRYMIGNPLKHFLLHAILLGAWILPQASAQNAATPTLVLDAGAGNRTVSPTFYGLMTEEINHSYDGGLYAELVQNRTFQDDPRTPAHWSVSGGDSSISLDQAQAVNDSLPTSLRLDVNKINGRPAGVANDGFWGIPIKPDTIYRASFFAKAADDSAGPLTVSLESVDGGTSFATAQTQKISNLL